MKINTNYELRQLSSTGFVLESQDKGELIVLNKTAAFIWETIKSGIDSEAELLNLIREKYQVDSEQADADLKTTISHWQSIGIIHS